MDISLARVFSKTWDGVDGNDGDLFVQGIFLMARVDHPEVLQRQDLYGNLHGAAPAGSIGIFELKTVASAFDHPEQIQLGTGMGCPEVGIAGYRRMKGAQFFEI